jgi:hypothetical protein
MRTFTSNEPADDSGKILRYGFQGEAIVEQLPVRRI